MKPQPTIEQTIAFLKTLYGNEPDKGHLAPIYHHPIAVLKRLPLYADMELKLAALLHDVIEDSLKMGTPVTADDLRARGYSERTVRTVELVTKVPGIGVYKEEMGYLEWIEAIIATGNMDALQVKYADVSENKSTGRIHGMSKPDQIKATTKYYKPYKLLHSAMANHSLLDIQRLPDF